MSNHPTANVNLYKASFEKSKDEDTDESDFSDGAKKVEEKKSNCTSGYLGRTFYQNGFTVRVLFRY